MEQELASKTLSSTTRNGSQSKTLQLIVFRLAGGEYAMRIDEVKEVVVTPAIAKVPLAPPFIKGVANIRGNILAIVDLENRFGLRATDQQENQQNFTLVIESDELKVGILVKEVPNTLAVSPDDIDQTTDLLQEASDKGGYIKGIVKTADGNRLIILIDVFKAIGREELAMAIR